MKEEIVLAWVCICFMFAAMTLSYAYMIRTNRWERFAHKCEVINMNHLSVKTLVENRGGYMLTPQGLYPVDKLVFQKWARMKDRDKVIIISKEAISQMQENFGMRGEDKIIGGVK